MITTDEGKQIDGTMDQTVTSEAALTAWFQQSCARFGTRTAVSFGAESVSYAELNRASDRVAARLMKLGVARGAVVAICLDRSIELVSAIIGVLKAGAFYLPLDARHPAARIAETLDDARPAIVLTSRPVWARFEDVQAGVLFVEDVQPGPQRFEPAGVQLEMRPGDAAYMIYTSGSTGKPKGVVVTHGNVVRLFETTKQLFGFNENDVWTMFHSCAFDFSVWEMWGALLFGGRLVIVPFGVSRSPEEFYQLLIDERVTVLNQTPSAFRLLDQVDQQLQSLELALRLVIFGGEALPAEMLRSWFQWHGDELPQLVNMYGITETTVHVTHRRMRLADAQKEQESVIGEPLADLSIYLLDEQQKPVASNVEGELYVGGPGVAKGYWNRPELSAERFVRDPFQGEDARMYRSGDMARRRADGELVYLGRRDGQVQINGFRVELGEVEAAICAHPAVLQACVIVLPETDGRSATGPRLAAYFSVQAAATLSTGDLSAHLKDRLPAHMLPSFYTRMERFPLTLNGKVDRKALPAPAGSRGAVERQGVGTMSALEEMVAHIWRIVLKTEAVPVDENFFDVGGSSLLLIAVRTGLQEQLDRQIPVAWMFECTTVRALAARLSESSSTFAASPNGLQHNAARQRVAFARAKLARSATR